MIQRNSTESASQRQNDLYEQSENRVPGLYSLELAIKRHKIFQRFVMNAARCQTASPSSEWASLRSLDRRLSGELRGYPAGLAPANGSSVSAHPESVD